MASPGRFPALDGLRGCAALAVLLFHGWALSLSSFSTADGAALYWLNRLLSLGWAGVDVFFTLSAFLLSLPFVYAQRGGAAAPDLRRYLMRRGLRILPAYYVQLLLVGVVFAASAPSLGTLAGHLILGLNIGADPVRPLLTVWWTLPVEFGFYLLLPMLALLLRPGRWLWLLLLVFAAAVYRHQVLHQPGIPWEVRSAWADHLPGRIDQFVLGMLAAYAWVQGRLAERLQGQARVELMALAGLLGLGAVLVLPLLLLGIRPGPAPSMQPMLIAWHSYASLALLPLLWAGAAGRGRLMQVLGSHPLRWLGKISFSLYLWHYPVMLLAREHVGMLPTSPLRPLWFNLMVLPACLLVAWLSWRLVEAPAMRWSRRDAPGDESSRLVRNQVRRAKG